MIIRGIVIAGLFLLGAGPLHAQEVVHVNDRPALELIGGVEAKSNYDTITNRTRLRPSKPLTQMTIREVLAFQERVADGGASSTAMGKYQFIHKTLDWLVDLYDIDRDTLFSAPIQDYLARLVLIRCGFYNAEADNVRLGNCMARAWAGLPMLSGDRRGRSYYPGNGNAALTRPEMVLSTLMSRFPPQEDVIIISLAD